MKIRLAQEKDVAKILELLVEIARFHYVARPDTFRELSSKYDEKAVSAMLKDSEKPIFVAVDDQDEVAGYAMCQLKENREHPVLKPYKLLYLDDLCVDEKARQAGVGGELMEYVKRFARQENCSRVELNVWEFPGSAREFYQHHGFKTQRREMEFWL